VKKSKIIDWLGYIILALGVIGVLVSFFYFIGLVEEQKKVSSMIQFCEENNLPFDENAETNAIMELFKPAGLMILSCLIGLLGGRIIFR
jgi:hypothetical protein